MLDNGAVQTCRFIYISNNSAWWSKELELDTIVLKLFNKLTLIIALVKHMSRLRLIFRLQHAGSKFTFQNFRMCPTRMRAITPKRDRVSHMVSHVAIDIMPAMPFK